MAKIWVKIREKGKNQIKSTLKILKLLRKLSQSCLRDTSEMSLLRCLINASVRQCLFLQESCLLDILKTSPQDLLQDSKFMTFAYAFECSKVRTFDFVNVMNCYIAIHNHLFVFRLLFIFKHVACGIRKYNHLRKYNH